MQNIVVKDISKSYYGKKAIDKVNFTLKAGQIIGLLGPNGAGKTTTMNIMTGVFAPDSGEVWFDGCLLGAETEQKIKQHIGFLSETNPLYQEMLVEEYLHFMAGLRGMDKAKREEAIERVAKETGIEDKLHQPIEELSKGYKQRVGLAQAILHQPDVLVLDEPTEGLDPNQRVTIRDLILSLGKNRTVIISSHVLSEIQALCDHVIILNQGKVVSQGSVEEVIKQGTKGQKIVLQAKGTSIRQSLEGIAGLQILSGKDEGGLELFELLSTASEDARPKLFELSKQKGWTLYELHQAATNLEEIFRSLTVGETK